MSQPVNTSNTKATIVWDPNHLKTQINNELDSLVDKSTEASNRVIKDNSEKSVETSLGCSNIPPASTTILAPKIAKTCLPAIDESSKELNKCTKDSLHKGVDSTLNSANSTNSLYSWTRSWFK